VGQVVARWQISLLLPPSACGVWESHALLSVASGWNVCHHFSGCLPAGRRVAGEAMYVKAAHAWQASGQPPPAGGGKRLPTASPPRLPQAPSHLFAPKFSR